MPRKRTKSRIPIAEGETHLCECGCGRPTPIFRETPRFLVGHHGPSHAPLAIRFRELVLKTDTCWLWQGPPMRNGYGRIAAGRKDMYAHRVAWEFAYGPIPKGLYVCHRCDVRLCVRPDHLFLGTHRDNMDDMFAKGRHYLGPRSVGAKITEEQVREIRRRVQAGGQTRQALADEFGLSRAGIWYIVNRKTWKDVA